MYQLPRGMNMEPKRQVFGWDDHERPKRDAGQALQATHLDGLASLDEASALSSSYALPRFVRDHAPPASGPGAWTVGKSRARTRELRRSSSDSLRSGGGGAYLSLIHI